jgi:undecaprenyl-diphosphatase
MNNFWNATLRGVIEAITEFLPVSSTGHLFLFADFFPFQGFGESLLEFEDLFDIFIQSGAILSVLVLYFPRFYGEAKSLGIWVLRRGDSDRSGFLFYTSLVIGSSPIMLIGFLLKNNLDQIKSSEYLLGILGFSWLIGGIFIWVQEKFSLVGDSNLERRNLDGSSLEEPKAEDGQGSLYFSFRQSIGIGFIQCFALIPGVSRSLVTIMAGRYFGLSRKEAAEYSFFLAVPVLVAAGVYKLYKHFHILDQEKFLILAYGTLISFILCVLIIRWFIGYIRKRSFLVFGYYRILLGFVVLFYFFRS